jgi:MFS family permease
MRGRNSLVVHQKETAEDKRFAVPEIAEVSAGSNARLSNRFLKFPALNNRNYRIFFLGQFLSVLGTWMQIVAQGWLVLQLTDSPFTIGLIAALATTPSLLFALFGGVVVDRFNKKRILYVTQSANMVLALLLGILAISGNISLTVIGTIAFLMGTVNAVDAPARQSFVSVIVNKDQLASAIALNSGVFNAARAIGPAVSGILIATVGSGAAFIINGISYLALLIALSLIRYSETNKPAGTNPIEAIRRGISYAFTHPLIRVLILFTGVLSIFGWSYSTLLPLVAKTVFGVEAKGLGYMYTATGLGSLLATYFVGAYSKKLSPSTFVIAGNLLFGISLLLFSLTNSLMASLPLLFFIGMGLLSQAATMNTLIQTVVRNEYRGRVMSLYVLMFLGMAPLGNFEIGFITEHLSLRLALIINSLVIMASGLFLYSYRHRIRDAYRHYNQVNP